MTWDYRIIEHDGKDESYFAIHEVYYSDKGEIETWTADPINITGDSAKDVTKILQTMLKDIKRPVLKESELEKKIGKPGKNPGRL